MVSTSPFQANKYSWKVVCQKYLTFPTFCKQTEEEDAEDSEESVTNYKFTQEGGLVENQAFPAVDGSVYSSAKNENGFQSDEGFKGNMTVPIVFETDYPVPRKKENESPNSVSRDFDKSNVYGSNRDERGTRKVSKRNVAFTDIYDTDLAKTVGSMRDENGFPVVSKRNLVDRGFYDADFAKISQSESESSHTDSESFDDESESEDECTSGSELDHDEISSQDGSEMSQGGNESSREESPLKRLAMLGEVFSF